jgi:hypothetical protein
MDKHKAMFSEAQIESAVAAYPRAVTGPMAGCRHPAAVLRFALANGGPAARLAGNFISTHHGACWNTLANVLPADGWLRWYAGDRKP